jgi:hypothetical protein
MRKSIGIVLCSVAPVWLILSVLQVRLLRAGILNTKDMPPFVGNETGTVSEYLLNVWHWDGVLLLLMVAALPCLAVGVVLLRRGRVHTGHENAV